MRLQESQHHRQKSKQKESPLSLAIKGIGGECRLLSSANPVNGNEQLVSLRQTDLRLVVPAHSKPADIVILRNCIEEMLDGTKKLEAANESLALRDKTLKNISSVMESYSDDGNDSLEFIESLGIDVKYALFHEFAVQKNKGFTEQALASGLNRLSDHREHSVRILNGEMFAFRYDPYCLLVQTAEPLPLPIKYLLRLYVREIGHGERIERRIRAEEKVKQMEWLANHDPLTNLANRRLLTQTADSLIDNAIKADTHATLHMDLDGFKAVNDTCGHAVGDDLLVLIAERIKDECHSDDLVCRLGGDEFVVLCGNIKNEEEVQQLASRLIDSIKIPTILSGKRCIVSVSIGIAWWRGSEDIGSKTVNEWMHEADQAMYSSKSNGKSCYRIAS